MLYSALDSEGNKVDNPLKSSVFGKMVGYDGLEKQMLKSTERIKSKNLKAHRFNAVSQTQWNCKSESEFRAKLKQQVIDVLSRRNDGGRIYGATFINQTTRTVLNASRLSKEYSANVFNELYGGKTGTTARTNKRNPFVRCLQQPTTNKKTAIHLTGV